MRFILVALIWLVLIGGLSFYIQQRDARIPPRAEAQVSLQAVSGNYALELTPTFGAAPDPFALQVEGEAPATLLVRLDGQPVYRSEAPLVRGETLRIAPLEGLVAGRNELYVEATPAFDEAHLSHALRVRLLRDGIELLDQTLWGEAGRKVSGSVAFTLAAPAEEAHDH